MRYALTSAMAAATPASSSGSTSTGSAASEGAAAGGAASAVAAGAEAAPSPGVPAPPAVGADTGSGEPFPSASKIRRHSSGTLAGLSR